MATVLKSKPTHSRVVLVEHGSNQLYAEVLPFLSPNAARSVAAGVAGLSVVAIACICLLIATPIVAFIFVMLALAGSGSALVALLAETEYPKLWLEAGKLTVQWHAGYVEAVRIGRHSAIVLLHGDGEHGLAGFTVQGEDGVLCFREQLGYDDFVSLIAAIDRVCFAAGTKTDPPRRRHATDTTSALSAGANTASDARPVGGAALASTVWSKRIHMITDEPKRLEFSIGRSAEGTGGVASLGVVCCIASIGLYFLSGSALAEFAWVGGAFGLAVLAGWFSWVTSGTRVKVADGQAEIVTTVLGIQIPRRSALSSNTVVGLRPVSIANDVPSYGIAIGAADTSVCFGDSLDNQEVRQLMYRLREVVGVAKDADAFFSVAVHDQCAAEGKQKHVLETQLPLDSAITLLQYDDDQVRIRLPATEYVGVRLALGVVVAATVLWIWYWLTELWNAPSELLSTDSIIGVCLAIVSGLALMLVGLYGAFGHRLLTITPSEITYSERLGPIGRRLSATHPEGLTEKLRTPSPNEELRSLASVQRGLEVTDKPASPSTLPPQLESLALSMGQKQRTSRELAGLLTIIHRQSPKSSSLQSVVEERVAGSG